jgi:hypothetical protein
MKPYRDEDAVDQRDTFRAPRERFERLIEDLNGDAASQLDHGQLERLLEREGFELIRVLLQSHLDLRAQREVRGAAVWGADGLARTHVRRRRRGLETIFGRVSVTRWSYGARGTTSVAPMDDALNLPTELYSEGLMHRVVREAAKGSFDEAVATIGLSTGGHVPKRQAEQLTVRAAVDFDAFYAQRAAQEVADTTGLLVMSVDGKGIVMRKQDLREETRRRAEQAQFKLVKRVTRGEVRNRKRDATVAAVYSIDANPRSAEEVMSGLGADARAGQQPRARNKRVWASVAKAAEEVIEEVFDEACRRDPQHQRSWVMLVDGNRQQLHRIRGALRKRRMVVPVVLDFIHVLEYLWRAAYCLHGEGTPTAERWVHQRATAILLGHSSNVAAGIRRSATMRKLTGKDRKVVVRCADYLLNHRDLLRYDHALAAGLPIATGVVEGACRHVVKDRMDVTGARWSLAGAEAILRLRSLKASNDLAEYWSFLSARQRAA